MNKLGRKLQQNRKSKQFKQEQAQLNKCATNKGDFICSPKKGQKLRKLALWFDLILKLKKPFFKWGSGKNLILDKSVLSFE